MSTLGEDFLAAAKMLGFEDAEGTISADDFATLSSDPNIAAFLKWFCDHASDFSVINRSDTALASTADEVQSSVEETTPSCAYAALSHENQLSSLSAELSMSDSVNEEFSGLPPIQRFLFESENRFLDDQIKTQTNYNRELKLIVSESIKKLKKMQKEAASNYVGSCDFQLEDKWLNLSVDVRSAARQAAVAVAFSRPIIRNEHDIQNCALVDSADSAYNAEVSEFLNELFDFLSQEDMPCRQQHVRDYCKAVNSRILSAKLHKAGMEKQLERLKWFNEHLPTLSACELEEFFESIQKSNKELKEEFSSLFNQWGDRLVDYFTDMQMEPILDAYYTTKLGQFSYWNEKIQSAVKAWETQYKPVLLKLACLRRKSELYETVLTHLKSVEQSLDRIASFPSSLQEVADSCASVEIELEEMSEGCNSLQQYPPAVINEFYSKIYNSISRFFSSGEVEQEMVDLFAVTAAMHFNKLLQKAQKELDQLKLLL
ncbi:hypothetical protein TTRE_0000557701 [Trichuris trichiura]|uniref:Uncharacterized protein n=1 Tax=Trichuris trichiura TaxID=36087 RepID=A0A077ZAJ3_TRITR|nr:hypothetical protein TTRE_0000557701 [Trichuris trichiura]